MQSCRKRKQRSANCSLETADPNPFQHTAKTPGATGDHRKLRQERHLCRTRSQRNPKAPEGRHIHIPPLNDAILRTRPDAAPLALEGGTAAHVLQNPVENTRANPRIAYWNYAGIVINSPVDFESSCDLTEIALADSIFV